MDSLSVLETLVARRNPDRRPITPNPASVPGAKRAPYPGFIEPCLASLRTEPPSGAGWIHEVKFDGYRAQAHFTRGKAVVYSRRGNDWTSTFANVAAALPPFKAKQLILDGEVVVLDANGKSDFHVLQDELAARRTGRLAYCVFDLLYFDGFDLRDAALETRKQLLADLVRHHTGGVIQLSEHFEAEGAEMFAKACALHLEGIVCKHRTAPYRSGRQESWLKVKCRKGDTYPIIAFVEKLGAKPRRIASLYLGRWDGERLLYAGKAGTGYTDRTARQLRELLDEHIRSTSPLTVPVKKPKATWLEPVVDAEVEYSSVTSGGTLRQAVFKGVRDDVRPPASERVAPQTRSTRQTLAVPRENILQLLPDAVTPPKNLLQDYWRRIAPRALRHLARRPLKLVRHVHGTTFYHMGPLPPIPRAVHQMRIQKRQGGEGIRLWVDDLQGLLALVDVGVVELHPWNSTVDDLEHPDTLVFDLDPGEGIDWKFVTESALRLRELLSREKLSSWPKLTGGKGLHVMVPVKRDFTHDQAHAYCKGIAQRLASMDRARYTISASMATRQGRIFIDYLRNGRGTTAIGTYSPRARPGFPIAAPVTWNDVSAGTPPDAFSLVQPFTRTKSGPARTARQARARRVSGNA